MWKDRELQHWLGMTLADWFSYGALALVIALFINDGPGGDLILAIGAVLCGFLSFLIGWRHEPECSDETNVLILVDYPLALVLPAGCVFIHFLCH